MTAATRPAAAPLHAWWLAIRPRTLGASLVPVAVGTAVAHAEGGARLDVAALCAAAAALMQIAANLANDALDFLGGVDGDDRLGPARVSASGLLPPRRVLAAAVGALAAAAALGVALVFRGGWPIAGVGAACILAAWSYSGGPLRLAARGLGELAAFVFFGLVAVMFTTYLQLDRFAPLAALAALPIGAGVAALMAVNNLRDVHSDRAAGKRTLAVRLGPRRARTLVELLVLGAPLGALALALVPGVRAAGVLPLAALPLAIALVGSVRDASSAREWGRALGGAARLHAVVGVLLCAGLVW